MLINRVINYGKQLISDSVREAVGKGQELRSDFDSFDPETGVFAEKPVNGAKAQIQLQSRAHPVEVPEKTPDLAPLTQVAKSEFIARMINDLSAIVENEITLETSPTSAELYDRAMIDTYVLFREYGQQLQEMCASLRDVEVVNLGLEDALFLCLADHLKQRSEAFSQLELHHDPAMLETFINIELSVLASKDKIEFDLQAKPVEGCEFLGTLQRYGLVDQASTHPNIGPLAPRADSGLESEVSSYIR